MKRGSRLSVILSLSKDQFSPNARRAREIAKELHRSKTPFLAKARN